MPGYYDYVLALIPTALFGVTALLLWSGWGATVATSVAGGSAALLVGHALFVNAPTTGADGAGPVDDAVGDAPRAPPASAD